MNTRTSLRAREVETGTAETTRSRQLPLIDLIGIGGLAAIIAIHTSELSSKAEETAYLGLGYLALIAGCVVALIMLALGDFRGWLLGGATAALTILGFVLTRTTGLPNAKDDIGNWGETIGIWSLVAEGAVVLLAALAIANRRR